MLKRKFYASSLARANSSWFRELWARIKDDGNKKAVYAPEIEGSLFPQTFKPLNIGNFTGILERIKMVQGVIPGISQSMTYLGKRLPFGRSTHF